MVSKSRDKNHQTWGPLLATPVRERGMRVQNSVKSAVDVVGGHPSSFLLPVNVGKNVGEDLEDDELEVLRHFGGVDADGLEDEDEVDGRPADREHHDHHQHQLRHSPLVPADGCRLFRGLTI